MPKKSKGAEKNGRGQEMGKEKFWKIFEWGKYFSKTCPQRMETYAM